MTFRTLWLPPATTVQACGTELPTKKTLPKLSGRDVAARILSNVFDQFFVYKAMNTNRLVH
jgi:hypothetical protein